MDRALLRGVRQDQLWDAFHAQPNRRGNRARAEILRDSRDSPWSEGERKLHRMPRRAHITGWVTNSRIIIRGVSYRPDLLFRRERPIVEFDGYEFHSSRAAHDRDRYRRNELELAGYQVLYFTWQQLIDDPWWVLDRIRRALDGGRRR